MNWSFFRELLGFDSTTGQERTVAEWLAGRLPELFPDKARPVIRPQEVGDGTLNLLFTWGSPRIVFCTHMDTVPPYIAPEFPEEGGLVRGRGSCDAKGQIFAMATACRRLCESGCTDFGLLLLAGEETGSWGAKAFAGTGFRAPFLVVGEPTDNHMVSASKGTKSFELVFTGEACHSGYPEHGTSAVDRFVNFMNILRKKDFGTDPLLGATTWNIGLLRSDNPQNILSPSLGCRLYFRTTFVSDEAVSAWMAGVSAAHPGLSLGVSPRGGDTPARYWTVDDIPSRPVAFGSDAPHLTNFEHKAICGPGSILVAHRDEESVSTAELEKAVELYVKLYHHSL